MSDYWSETGKLFGSLIEKPKMAEKLLKRPPPKYIYDIIMNTMKKTGFPKGLFTSEEEDVKYFEADAKHKSDIIQKVIDITKIITNENFDIKVTSILKGEQCDKTNYFLRAFYNAATNGKDNSKYIEKYLEHKSKKEKKEEKAPSKAEPAKAKKKKDDDEDDDAKKDDGIKLTSGTGMKLESRIFKHDITGEKKEEKQSKVSNVDLEVIKESVQNITKNCNPIGKIMEFLSDDIEGMNKELLNWIKENKSYKEKYDDEIKKSDETLLPLQNELLELEDAIRDEMMQIKSIKSRLIKNEKIIHNLITNVISFKSENK